MPFCKRIGFRIALCVAALCALIGAVLWVLSRTPTPAVQPPETTAEAPETIAQDERLAAGHYIPVECVYMAPFSSYYPMNLSEDFQYTVTQDSFIRGGEMLLEENTTRNIDWHWKSMEKAKSDIAFLEMYSFYRNTLDESSLYQKVDNSTHIFLDDGTLYLVNGGVGRNALERLWSIYRLVPEET